MLLYNLFGKSLIVWKKLIKEKRTNNCSRIVVCRANNLPCESLKFWKKLIAREKSEYFKKKTGRFVN